MLAHGEMNIYAQFKGAGILVEVKYISFHIKFIFVTLIMLFSVIIL